jgi:hypothetical protein
MVAFHTEPPNRDLLRDKDAADSAFIAANVIRARQTQFQEPKNQPSERELERLVGRFDYRRQSYQMYSRPAWKPWYNASAWLKRTAELISSVLMLLPTVTRLFR